MKKTTLFSLLATVLVATLASAARASTILAAADFNTAAAGHSAPFNTPAGNYVNGGLIGQNGWINTNSTVNPLTITGNDANGVIQMTNNGEDDRLPFTAVTTGSTYLSADINLSAAQTGDYFISLGDGSTSIFYTRVYAKAVTGGYALALLTNGSTAPTVYGAAIPFNTPEHIVVEYDMVAGAANDTSELYLNPTDPIQGGDNLYINGILNGTDATSIAAVYLRQGSASAAPSQTVDNIAVATVVPEPSALVLGGLSLFGLVGAAIRRKAS